jgi:predicted RND superfamily exporter protein
MKNSRSKLPIVSKLLERSTHWIVDLPILSGLLVVAISAVAIAGYVNPNWLKDSFSDPPPVTAVDESQRQEIDAKIPDVDAFSLGGDVVLVVQSDQLFTPSGAAALRAVADALDSTDFIRRVIWMDRVPMLNIFGLPEPVFPHAAASPQQYAAARQKALDHPFIGGQLLSTDGNTTLIMLSIDALFVESDEDCIAGIKQIAEAAAVGHPDVPMQFSITGWMPSYVTAMKSHNENQFQFMLIGYGVIAIMAVVLFRGIAAVMVVALAPALGVFWTLGFINYFGFGHNPFNDVVLPVLVSLVGLTDGVHLLVQIRTLRSAGMAPKDAAKTGLKDVGLACALTSLTTAIGFGSLATANHEFVREFGVCCVVGVVLSFVAVVTAIPLVCSTWVGKFVHVGQEKSLVDQQLDRIGVIVQWVLARKRVVSQIAIVSTVVLIVVSLTLRPDDRRSNALPTQSEPARSIRLLDKQMGGIDSNSIIVQWDETIESDSPQVMEFVAEVDALLAKEPLIGHPLSIANLIDALPGDGDVADRMSMLELLPPPLKRAFYTPERRRAVVTFRVQDLGIRKYSAVFSRVETGLAEMVQARPGFTAEMSGDSIWRWQNLYEIVVDLATSLGVASLIIFAVLAMVYRSLRIGLISIVPNCFPLAVAGTWLAMSGQSLEVVTVCAFTVCLGIAVDDTIHFLTRFLEERKRTDDDEEAIGRAFTGVGTALIMTTIVLVAGFSTVLLSDSRDHFIFASMGAITLTAALFADLIFLPALLARFVKR